MPVPWCRALLVDLLVERWWAGRAFAGTLVPTGHRRVRARRSGARHLVRGLVRRRGDRPLANDTNGWRVVSTGNEVRVMDTPSTTDKSIRLNRTTDGGGIDGTNLARIFGTPLQGVVTIEAQVMRNDTQAGWFGCPTCTTPVGARPSSSRSPAARSMRTKEARAV
jgi:hypothetical protein